MKKFNFIFTGFYLRLWYVAFGLTVALMVLNYVNLNKVVDFEVIVFDSAGQVVETTQVQLRNDYEKAELYKRLPVTKAFLPVK